MKDAALIRALAPRGNASRIARAARISTGAVAQWTQCPAEHAKIVEALTGVPRHELRPDLWEMAMTTDAQPNASDTDDGAKKSPARVALEEAQAILSRYVDPSDSLSDELIRDRRAASVRGD